MSSKIKACYKNLLIVFLLCSTFSSHAGTYQISGTFNGCQFNKYYPIFGYNLLLKCEEYNYFYEYMPTVESDGRRVITIGDQRINATLVDGEYISTYVSGDFEGCDFDKRYRFDNGFTFVCNSYSYSYSYRPEVKIIIPFSGYPIVYINDEQYDGSLYK